MSRPDRDTYFIRMARLVGTRSSCLSRQVGCVLVNKRNHVLATGYNGPPAGYPHCTSCARENPGKDLDICPATHAEQNALLQCHDVYQIEYAYCTDSPCVTCVKLLMNTSCRVIYYDREYPDPLAKELWLNRELSVYTRKNFGYNREWLRYGAEGLLDKGTSGLRIT